MTKTIELTANIEKTIEFIGGSHVKVKNLSDDTVYISQHDSVIVGADGVKSIQAETTDIVTDVATYSIRNGIGDYYGTIYALATKDCQIELEPTNYANFKFIKKGGGGSGDSAFIENKKFVQILDDNIRTYIGTYEKEEI